MSKDVFENMTVDEMVTHFNQKLTQISCPISDKIELLCIVLAIVAKAQEGESDNVEVPA